MKKVYVAGHQGLVGSSLVRAIELRGEYEWIGASSAELDLRSRSDVFRFVNRERPDAIVIAAAKVGGILANNTYPVQFLSENIQIATNLLDASHDAGIARVLFLGSSCIYPRMAPQPIKEEYLLTGELEPTNEAYALAKISGLKLVQAYRRQHGHRWISAMPTNLYGPGDNFDRETSHVLPALLRRFHEAAEQKVPEVTVWGSGNPRREFLFVDDLADACLFLLENYDDEMPINVGTGRDISIRELAESCARTVGFDGRIAWDTTKPDGTPRKLLNVDRLANLGWRSNVELSDGLVRTFEWYRRELASGRVRSGGIAHK